MRQFLLVIAGAPGRLAVSAAALATVLLTAAGYLPALLAGAVVVAGWSTVFAVGFLIMMFAAQVTGVYDDAPTPPPQQGGPHAQG